MPASAARRPLGAIGLRFESRSRELPVSRVADISNSVGTGCGGADPIVQGAIATDHVLRMARVRAEQLLRVP